MAIRDDSDHSGSSEAQVPPTGLTVAARAMAVYSGGNSGASITDGNSNFLSVTGHKAVDPSEGDVQIVAPRAGTLRDFFVNVGINSLNGNMVLTVRINGVDTSITVTFGSTETGEQSDTTNTATVAAGDLLSIEVDTTAASAGSALDVRWGMIFRID